MSRTKIVIIIAVGSVMGVVGLGSLIFYETVNNTPSFLNARIPNQVTETNNSCDTFGEGQGHIVSGTDSYGYGYVSCVSNEFTVDDCRASGNRDSCERVILVE